MSETTRKLPAKPFTGEEGNTFSKDNQPDPELKKKGWEQWRKERHLTQTILKEMLGKDGQPGTSLKEYVESLLLNAKAGNSKAIETINKCLEDDIIKIAQTDGEGNNIEPTIVINHVSIPGFTIRQDEK